MARFTVSLTDQTTELIPGADAYQQEGPMTTFFARAEGRVTIDSWSQRVASYRTADIVAVRSMPGTASRHDESTSGAGAAARVTELRTA